MKGITREPVVSFWLPCRNQFPNFLCTSILNKYLSVHFFFRQRISPPSRFRSGLRWYSEIITILTLLHHPDKMKECPCRPYFSYNGQHAHSHLWLTTISMPLLLLPSNIYRISSAIFLSFPYTDRLTSQRRSWIYGSGGYKRRWVIWMWRIRRMLLGAEIGKVNRIPSKSIW